MSSPLRPRASPRQRRRHEMVPLQKSAREEGKRSSCSGFSSMRGVRVTRAWRPSPWIPAFAGMTARGSFSPPHSVIPDVLNRESAPSFPTSFIGNPLCHSRHLLSGIHGRFSSAARGEIGEVASVGVFCYGGRRCFVQMSFLVVERAKVNHGLGTKRSVGTIRGRRPAG